MKDPLTVVVALIMALVVIALSLSIFLVGGLMGAAIVKAWTDNVWLIVVGASTSTWVFSIILRWLDSK